MLYIVLNRVAYMSYNTKATYHNITFYNCHFCRDLG